MAAVACMTLASCDVELLPLDTVILENYWTNKDDVESVVASCYADLCQNDVLTRMLIWGEVRSDNVIAGQQISSGGNDLKHLLQGNLFDTNGYCTWSGFYKAINECNTVERYAPMVQERDPNFTESDLMQSLAEVKAIRALCYFYLIRTFGDVPFTFVPSIDDSQNYIIPATKQELILDTLIMDLEASAKFAPVRYVEENKNSGRITRNAVYALLADLYLWRASNANVEPTKRNADYLQCVNYCDRVIESKIAEYKEDRYGSLKRQISKVIYADYGYPLIEEWAEADQTSGTGVTAKAYNLIFGQGHSFESLFELSFSSNEASGGTTNGVIGNMYGNSSSSENGAYLAANESMINGKLTSSTKYDYENGSLFTAWDFRSQENFKWDETQSYNILKYVVNNMKVRCGATWEIQQNTPRSQNYANWIIYRLTDVMLMKAEAEVQIADYLQNYVPEEEEADTTATDSTSEEPAGVKTRAPYYNEFTTAEEYYDDVFNIVCAVYFRSCPQAKENAKADCKPAKSSLINKNLYDKFVEAERRRELMFEGKRYYDLVRRARRDGSTSYVASLLSGKFENAKALGIKMAQIDFLYMPIAEDELDRNPLLKQNPAFSDKEKKNELNI